MASRYGGIAVEDPQTGSRFGGIPVEEESHPLDSILHGAKDLWEQVNPVSKVKGIHQAMTSPIETMRAMGKRNEEMALAAKKSYDEGDYPSAIRHAINYLIPMGSGVEQQSDKFAKGDIAGGVGGSLGMGADLALVPKIPTVARAAGRGLQRAAEPIAESALAVKATQRAFGKTPGRAALEETTGFRPTKVAESARQKLGEIESELTTRAKASSEPASLEPARKVLDERSKLAASGNSEDTPAELGSMREQLTEPRPGFGGQTAYPPGAATPVTFQPGPSGNVLNHLGQPVQGPPKAIPGGPPPPLEIAAEQSPSQILRMKREFNNDFLKWDPLHPQREMGTGRQVYRELDKELDRTVPGARELNQRTSSLIPVAEQAEKADLKAGVMQNVMHRGAAHTGAALMGVEGFRHGGIPGAITGFVVPELLATPTARMAGARGLFGAGKGIAKTGRAAQVGSVGGTVLRRKEDDPLGLFQ